MLKLSRKKKDKGFTLVELIVVIAILAILVGLLAPQYTKYVEKSRKSADVSNLDNLVTGLKVAASDHEYNLGNTTGTTVYTIIIAKEGTTLTIDKDNTAKDNSQAAKALNSYAGTKFKEDGTVPTTDSLTIKSNKWGEVEGSTSTSAISATITIDNSTDAVTVKYSPNVDNYSDHGNIDSKNSTPPGKDNQDPPSS